MLAEIVFSRLSLTGFRLAPVSYLYSSKYRSQIVLDILALVFLPYIRLNFLS